MDALALVLVADELCLATLPLPLPLPVGGLLPVPVPVPELPDLDTAGAFPGPKANPLELEPPAEADEEEVFDSFLCEFLGVRDVEFALVVLLVS